MERIESIGQAREAENRRLLLTCYVHDIDELLERIGKEDDLTEIDRDLMEGPLLDARKNVIWKAALLQEALNKWSDVENYGSAVETPEYARVM